LRTERYIQTPNILHYYVRIHESVFEFVVETVAKVRHAEQILTRPTSNLASFLFLAKWRTLSVERVERRRVAA